MIVANAGACPGRADMCTRTNAVTIKPAAGAHGPDMRPCMHAAVADTGARCHHAAGMAAGGNTMLAHPRARTHRSDMGARAHAVLAGMDADTHAQYIDTHIRGECHDRRKQAQRKNGGKEDFHVCHPAGFGTATGGRAVSSSSLTRDPAPAAPSMPRTIAPGDSVVAGLSGAAMGVMVGSEGIEPPATSV